MQNLKIKKLILSSLKEQKGLVLEFDQQTTILTGLNDTGKSSVLKSIVGAFGTNTTMHDKWKDADISTLLHFSVGDSNYSILRQKKQYTLFNNENSILGKYTSVTKGLGPHLAQIFNFELKLINKSGESITPPPAFLFLPYYFDQDRSWTEAWRSFDNLQQMSNWKKDLIEYHVGIRPNEYYKAKGKLGILRKKKDELSSEQVLLANIRNEVKKRLKLTTFNISLEDFTEEIKELLIECEKLQTSADEVKNRLVNLHNERTHIEAHIAIARNTLREIGKDYNFLEKADHLDCPTCGATYETDFSTIFKIAVDEDRCEELLQRLIEELNNVKERIAKENLLYKRNEADQAKIQALLAQRKKEVKLQDLIECESKRQVNAVLEDQMKALALNISTNQFDLDEIEKQMDDLCSKEIKDNILTEFRGRFKDFLWQLAVHGFNQSKFRIDSKIKEQGSDLSRALLAYGFSILHVMKTRSSSCFCPIIIDSPIQQEQDKQNHVRVLEFIKDNMPHDSQLIMGVVDAKSVDFGGKVVKFTNKYSALSEDFYEESNNEIDSFIKKSILFESNQ